MGGVGVGARETADTNAKGLNFPVPVSYCVIGRPYMFLFLVAGLQLLLNPCGATVPVCLGLKQTRSKAPCTVPV